MDTVNSQFFTNDLTFWPRLRQVDPRFLGQVERFLLVPKPMHPSSGLLMWTRDNRCYQHLGLTTEEENNILGSQHFARFTENSGLVELVSLRGYRIVQVESKFGHIMALTSEGLLLGWGDNYYGQVGVACREDQLIPAVVMCGIRVVCTGPTQTVAIDFGGSVWCWGENQNPDDAAPTFDQLSPLRLGHLGSCVIDVCCGNGFSFALNAQGEVHYWGRRNASWKSYQVNLDCVPRVVRLGSLWTTFKSCLVVTDTNQVYMCKLRGSLPQFEEISIEDEDIQGESLTNVCYGVGNQRVSFQRTTGGLVFLEPFYSEDQQLITHWKTTFSSLESVADLLAFRGEHFPPGIVQITEAARRTRFDAFNNPHNSDIEIFILDYRPEILHVDCKILDKSLALRLEGACVLGEVSYDIAFSYLHYVYREAVIDLDELAYPLFALLHYVKDIRLLTLLSQEMAINLAYFHHKPQSMPHVRRSVMKLQKNCHLVALLKSQVLPVATLQAYIIRWMILGCKFKEIKID